MQKVFTILFLFISYFFYAQDGKSISGIVYEGDANKDTLFFAKVSIKETEQKMTTDFRGRFYFEDLKPGKYTLVYQFLGCQTQTKEIIVDTEDIRQEVHLEKAKLFNDTHLVGMLTK